MAVYNKLTQNKQEKGPVFYLVEKLHTLNMDSTCKRRKSATDKTSI